MLGYSFYWRYCKSTLFNCRILQPLIPYLWDHKSRAYSHAVIYSPDIWRHTDFKSSLRVELLLKPEWLLKCANKNFFLRQCKSIFEFILIFRILNYLISIVTSGISCFGFYLLVVLKYFLVFFIEEKLIDFLRKLFMVIFSNSCN